MGCARHTIGPHRSDWRLDRDAHAPGWAAPVRVRRRWRALGAGSWRSRRRRRLRPPQQRADTVIIALVTLPLSLLGMQQQGGAGIAARLAGRVSPEVATLVVELGTAASARGLPVDPLIQKAIEGSAKGVPFERVAAAVRLVAMRLDTAAEALRQGGLAFDTVVLAAGPFGLHARVGRHH